MQVRKMQEELLYVKGLLEAKSREAAELDEQLQEAEAKLHDNRNDDARLRANLQAQLDAIHLSQVCPTSSPAPTCSSACCIATCIYLR